MGVGGPDWLWLVLTEAQARRLSDQLRQQVAIPGRADDPVRVGRSGRLFVG
jgi:hypothetical protein